MSLPRMAGVQWGRLPALPPGGPRKGTEARLPLPVWIGTAVLALTNGQGAGFLAQSGSSTPPPTPSQLLSSQLS